MTKIFNWTARRSGNSLTILGVDAAGRDVKVTHVDEVQGPTERQPTIKVRGANGGLYELALHASVQSARGAA